MEGTHKFQATRPLLYKMNFQTYTLASQPDWACIQIRAPESEARQPVHLCCLIDTSGSMEMDAKLENVKRSLHFLLDFLGPEDKVSIITFSEAARTILSQVAVTAVEKENIRARISIMRPETNTNLSASIVECRASLSTDTTTVKQGVILLTDGHANLGLTRPQDILELVQNTIAKFSGTSISCVGYGGDHNAELLQSISTEGGGSYYMVNNLEDVAAVFGNILGGLISCTAQQVRVLLPAGTELKSRYATGGPAGGGSGPVEVTVGDMTAGAEAAFLARVPTGGLIVLKGYNLLTHDNFTIDATVVATDDIDMQATGMAHYLRFEVLAILDRAKAFVASGVGGVTDHVRKIDEMIATIMAHQRDHANPLWEILLAELAACKESLQTRHLAPAASAQMMTQRVGYLGQMRGLAAASPSQWAGGGGPGSGESSPVAGTPSGPVGRTFSNYAQVRISSQLAAAASARPMHGAPTQSQDPMPHSAVGTPYGSPVLGGLAPTGSIALGAPPPISLWSGSGGPIARQNALTARSSTGSIE
jgi:secreted protein with Ig-like and vWFA domain